MMFTLSLPTFPLNGGGGAIPLTKGELVDDNLSDFELCDDNGDIMLIED